MASTAKPKPQTYQANADVYLRDIGLVEAGQTIDLLPTHPDIQPLVQGGKLNPLFASAE